MINRLCGAMKKGVWRASTGKCGFRTTSVVRGFAVCALIAVCMAVLALPRNVRADELPDEGRQNVETELERLLNEYDFSEWQQYFDETKQTLGNITEYGDVKTLIEKAASNVIEADEPTSILLIVKDIFVPNLRFALVRTAGIAALGILTGLCGIAIGDECAGTKKMLLLFLCAAAILSISAVFSDLTGTAADAIGKMRCFSETVEPIMIGLLTAMGCAKTAKLMNPMLVFLINGIVYVIEKIVLPMLLAAGVLTIVDGLSDKLKVGRTVKLLHKSVKWLLGLLTTVYIAVTVVGGMTAGAADGISVRTAKYAIDRLVPAAGGMVTGAADAVLGSSALLKNSAGTVAIILAAAVIAKPMLTVAGGMSALLFSPFRTFFHCPKGILTAFFVHPVLHDATIAATSAAIAAARAKLISFIAPPAMPPFAPPSGSKASAIAAAVAAAISLRNTFSIFPPSANVFKEH